MATIIIPVRNDLPAYKFKIDLEGVMYVLDFGFNARSNLWYMSIMDQAETLILGDLPILVNVPLADQYVKEGLPPGRFIAVDETGNKQNPGIDNFGSDVKLFYQESENV